MRYRKIGTSDLMVSTICQGGWSISGGLDWGEQDRAESIAAVRASLEAGVNFFDTAEVYGDGTSEEIFAEALQGHRDEVVLASKVSSSHLAPGRLARSCEQSLQRLRTDRIDLYQVHWPTDDPAVEDYMETLTALREQGKIREIGVSNFGVDYLDGALAAGSVQSNQLPYSLLWRPIEHRVQPLCEARTVSILCYSPLMQGLLTGKFRSVDDVPEGRRRSRLFSGGQPHARHGEHGCEEQTFAALERIESLCRDFGRPMAEVSLAWLLHRPAVATVIAGSRTAGQARQNARAGDLDLPADLLEQLAEATEPILQAVGENCDMWQSDSRMVRAD